MKTLAQKFVATAAVLGSAVGMASANAVGSGLDTILAAIDITTVSASVVALAVLLVGIQLVFKGPDISKRVITKV